jgi:methionine-rich copper-binding protein CopC
MDPATINTSTFNIRITSSGQILAGTVTYNATTRVAEFIPTSPLPNLTNLTVTVTTGVKDLAGNAMAAPFTVAWTTRDEDGPTVVSSTPANNAQGVATNAAVTVTFSEAVQASTINTTNLFLRVTSTGANVPGTLVFNGTNTVTFTPSSPLAQSTGYSFNVSGVKDLPGNNMPAPFVLNFQTGDTTPPTVLQVVPRADSVNVPTGSSIQVVFSETMDQATINATTVTLRTTISGVLVTTGQSYNASTNVLTITPAGVLAPSTGYTLTIAGGAAGVKDISGNPLAVTFTSKFTTAALPDIIAPKVVSITPANGAIGVAIDTVVKVRFSEAMQVSTINSSSITLRLTTGSATNVAATVACTATPCTDIVLDPAANLLNDTSYTITVTTSVKDLAGNPLAQDSVAIFRTKPDSVKPQVLGTSPNDGAAGVSRTAAITITFSESLKPASVTGSSIFLAPTAGGANALGTVSYNDSLRQAIFTPQSGTPLLANTQYTVTITPAVQDLAGNGLLATQFKFTTGP